jgi:hypothetical protein
MQPSRIATLRGVRREMAQLYVDAREGRENPSTAAKLTYILQAIQKCLESERIEERISVLETKAADDE